MNKNLLIRYLMFIAIFFGFFDPACVSENRKSRIDRNRISILDFRLLHSAEGGMTDDVDSIVIPSRLGIVNERNKGKSGFVIIAVKRDSDASVPAEADMKIIKQICSDYLKTGKLLVALQHPNKGGGKLLAEDQRIQLLDLSGAVDYKRFIALKRKIEKYSPLIKRMQAFVALPRTRRVPKELKTLYAKSEDFGNGLVSESEYADTLARLSAKVGVSLAKCESFRKMRKLKRLGNNIETRKAEYENEIVLELLKRALNGGEWMKIEQAKNAMDAGEMPKFAYYDLLRSLVKRTKINLNDYKHLKAYMEYLNLSVTIEKDKLRAEMEKIKTQLEKEILLKAKDEEKRAASDIKDFDVFFKILSLNPSKRDYNYFVRNKDRFRIDKFMDFINREADLVLSDDTVRETDVMAITMMDHSINNMKEVMPLLPEAERYLASKFRTEEGFMMSIIQEMENTGLDIGVVLVSDLSGAMIKELKDNSISYVIISPLSPEQNRKDAFPETMILKGR